MAISIFFRGNVQAILQTFLKLKEAQGYGLNPAFQCAQSIHYTVFLQTSQSGLKLYPYLSEIDNKINPCQ